MEPGSRRTWLAGAAVVAVVLATAVFFLAARGKGPAASEEFATTIVRWQAPSEGATAVRYRLRIQDVAAATEDTFLVAAQPGPHQSFAFTKMRPGREYRVCAAGIDAQDRQGPWSGWSPAYRGAGTAARP